MSTIRTDTCLETLSALVGCDGQPNIDFVENLLLFAAVKEFCKSTKN